MPGSSPGMTSVRARQIRISNSTFRHCQRQRSNPFRRVKKEWIASSLSLLAMTANTLPHSRGAFRPSFAINFPPSFRGRRECRAPGAPAAARVVVVNTRVSHHEYTGITRHSPRSGFNSLFRDLPGDLALLPPSPLRSLLLKNLTSASRRQDHTTSPVRYRAIRQRRNLRPPHPVPNVRDDRETPPCGTGWTRV
jgi:hypothetical protein